MIGIIALCSDTPEAIRSGKHKHNCDAIMLSDRPAKVIDLMGVHNQGVHTGLPGGVIRWIDQSENYQRRSNPDYVMSAIKTSLNASEPTPA